MNTLQGIGIWSSELRYGDPSEVAESAAELEALGFTALWVPDVGGPVYESLDNLLAATSTTTVATGILNVWKHDSASVGEWWPTVAPADRARVLLGLGVSHGPFIGEKWTKPLATMRSYLDDLDAMGDNGPPIDQRCVAALGPKMLELAAQRTAGACPYLVTPDHTAIAREALGDGGLFVEQGFILERDPLTARTIARESLDHYFGLPNYANNWKRLGFTDDDVESRSDRLIDALVVWGDVDAVGARVEEHFAAGADHVCLQSIAPFGTDQRDAWRAVGALIQR
ncbi:MAG: TIGR03620 family F420-dependent LLM class oxidoreductase [Actinobacteria bacterium]|nr:TIGR03620 family F420-dependent LLM class oxidoreductase [Actinomycetota bacterium]